MMKARNRKPEAATESFILDGLRYLLRLIIHQQNNLEFMRCLHKGNVVGQSPTYSIHMMLNAMVMPFQSIVILKDGERALLFARLRRLTLR
jgi:hypothetical protein